MSHRESVFESFNSRWDRQETLKTVGDNIFFEGPIKEKESVIDTFFYFEKKNDNEKDWFKLKYFG